MGNDVQKGRIKLWVLFFCTNISLSYPISTTNNTTTLSSNSTFRYRLVSCICSMCGARESRPVRAKINVHDYAEVRTANGERHFPWKSSFFCFCITYKKRPTRAQYFYFIMFYTFFVGCWFNFSCVLFCWAAACFSRLCIANIVSPLVCVCGCLWRSRLLWQHIKLRCVRVETFSFLPLLSRRQDSLRSHVYRRK